MAHSAAPAVVPATGPDHGEARMSISLLGAGEPGAEQVSGNVISRLLTKARSARNLRDLSASRSQPQTYHRVIVEGDDGDADFQKCAQLIATIILTRDRYKDFDKGTEEDEEDVPKNTEIIFRDGIFTFTGMKTELVPWKLYVEDLTRIFSALESGHCLSTCRTRLTIVQEEFELYSLLNTKLEEEADIMRRGGGVFAHSAKVDNNLRLHTAANAQQLVEFIGKTCAECGGDEVARDPVTTAPITLRQLCANLGIDNASELTVEGLGLHPPLRKRWKRFDVLQPKLNIAGPASAEFLQVFLKHNNFNQGNYLARLTRSLLEARERGNRQRVVATEMKFPLYGTSIDEWGVLARWMHSNQLLSYRNNRWIAQICRDNTVRTQCKFETNEEQIRNIFEPLFQATMRPDDPANKPIANLLRNMGGFSIVSDETLRMEKMAVEATPPHKIPWSVNPPDYYFYYYVYTNISSLNALRRKRGLNTFQFRTTCGEATGDFDQLSSSFLLADSINQGVRLAHSWVLQYLYMFARIGVVFSPLSNNSLYVNYFDNVFPLLFKRGLNVSLGTDDPLHNHHSDEPLMEEYGTAAKIYLLSPTDVSEIARNSVLMSSFPHETKVSWLGTTYALGPEGNDITKSSVCDFRLQFRDESLLHEQTVLNLMISQSMKVPVIVGKIKSRRQKIVGKDAVDLVRSLRRINYTDRRIVYPRIDIFGGESSQTAASAEASADPLQRALFTRRRYRAGQENRSLNEKTVTVEEVFRRTKDDTSFREDVWESNNFYGIFLISKIGKPPQWPPANIPRVDEFMSDIAAIREIVMGNSDMTALANHRLCLLEHKFGLHLAMNVSREAGRKDEKDFNNRDFFTAHKVDCNVHTDAGMNARQLLGFFIEKALHNGHDVVFERENKPVTLRELLQELNIVATRMTVDELVYIFAENQSVRDLFLSTGNYMGGRYFAELSKLVLDQHKHDAFTFAELRLIINGRNLREWEDLAAWFDRYGMASKQNRWMIRIPRQYRRLRQASEVQSFGEFLDNIFAPLWEVSLHPAKYTKFHYFLSHVSGFDSVDDESKVDLPMSETLPHDWTSDLNPPYNFYLYYLWANIESLNAFRDSRGLSTFTFRPQCGERGNVDHLIGGFLLADSISHGVTLNQYPTLEYLYYIARIGITMSPLSETAESVPYLKNPFPKFFARGLNVSLTTNRPLYFHFTQEPLIEEYAIASKIWKLSYNDLSEIARNSVSQSGFDHAWKAAALGKLHFLHSTLGNDPRKSRVSDIRVAYRFEVYHTELNFLDELLAQGQLPRAMRLLEVEVDEYERVTGRKVEMPVSDEDNDDEGAPATRGDETMVLANVRRQLDELNVHLHKSKMHLQELASDQASMAATLRKLKGKSGEPVVLRANLQ